MVPAVLEFGSHLTEPGHGKTQAWRRAARALESLAVTLEAEVPDTAATMRLSSLELADAIEEVPSATPVPSLLYNPAHVRPTALHF